MNEIRFHDGCKVSQRSTASFLVFDIQLNETQISVLYCYGQKINIAQVVPLPTWI